MSVAELLRKLTYKQAAAPEGCLALINWVLKFPSASGEPRGNPRVRIMASNIVIGIYIYIYI